MKFRPPLVISTGLVNEGIRLMETKLVTSSEAHRNDQNLVPKFDVIVNEFPFLKDVLRFKNDADYHPKRLK
ncbi:integration host factor subunit beta [Rhodobacterales bacterium HTCC2150]|nr:integration host factor subunit beta [Rhodobacterales bacterium HTCC2150] [Rhodobacteraceae bacterium HTCC2150]